MFCVTSCLFFGFPVTTCKSVLLFILFVVVVVLQFKCVMPASAVDTVSSSLLLVCVKLSRQYLTSGKHFCIVDVYIYDTGLYARFSLITSQKLI